MTHATHVNSWYPTVHTSVTRVKTSVCFTYRIYPFKTYSFFRPCNRGTRGPGAAGGNFFSFGPLVYDIERSSAAGYESRVFGEMAGRGGRGAAAGCVAVFYWMPPTAIS